MRNNKIRAYITHTIRGKQGAGATDAERREHSKKAIVFGNALRKEFPNVDFYVPGEHHELDTIAYRKDYMTEEQILDIDCVIVSRCSFLVVFSPDDYVSEGMRIEVDYAVANDIPVIAAVDGSEEQYFKRICYGVNCHLTSIMR